MPSELYPELEKLLIDMLGRNCTNKEIILAIQSLYHIDVFPRGGTREMYNMISDLKKTLKEKNED